MRAHSLRRRLLVWLLVSTVVFEGLALLDTWGEATRTANTVSDRVLIGSALAMAERVTVGIDGMLEADVPYSALEMLTSTAQDRVFYRIDGPQGFITGYEELPRAALAEDRGFADVVFAGEAVRVATLSRAATTGEGMTPFTVTVAESTLARRELARTILLRSALRMGLFILLAAGIVWVAVTLSLRPLARLEAALSARSPDDLRPILDPTPQELAALIAAMNGFIARAGTAIAAFRNFTGNASHQLRTPLATLRAELALAERATSPEDIRAAVARADRAVARAERILAQLLVLARVDAARGPLQAVDLDELARRVTGDLVPDAARRTLDLGYEGAPAQVHAEPILLEELLRNLIDNALAYAGTGAEVTVRVSVPATITVEDNGPGIPAEGRDVLMRRFSRGTAGRGLGLGLPIVAEIAALFKGTVRIEERPGGGLRVSVDFPAVE